MDDQPRLLPCPPALRARAAEIVGTAYGDPPTVPGAELADLLPPGLVPGAGWPQGDDLLGLASSPRSRLAVFGDVVVGGCGPVGEPVDGVQEIGYGFAPAYRGRGLGTAFVGLLVEELAGRVAAVSAEMLEGNVASWRLVERLGFVPTPTDRVGHRRYERRCG